MKEVSEPAYFLGLDTSCYTTSCAIVDETGQIVGEARKLLTVKPGARGLAQSNMVFQHTRAMPALMAELPQVPLRAIAVSAFPRREEGSYMPAFLVGKGLGESMAHMMGIPCYHFSHQENHVLAALRAYGTVPEKPFFSLHLSGGTTELLHCVPTADGFFHATLLGATQDLNSGQWIDRVGVQLGLPFPAGPHLEALALQGTVERPIAYTMRDGMLSYSGPASEAKRRVERGDVAPTTIAAEVFHCIAESLQAFLAYHFERQDADRLIAVGGVMSNSILRAAVTSLCERMGKGIYFAEPRYSADNATGNAFGACWRYRQEHPTDIPS